MTRQLNKIRIYICIVVAVLVTMLGALSGRRTPSAFADSSYDILDDFVGTDLELEDYPIVHDQHDLELVQLAESEDKSLFLYVYHPSADISLRPAKKVSMTTEAIDTVEFRLYDLELVGYTGTIGKYKVKDFTVSSLPIRYYGIPELYRSFDQDIDEAPTDGSEIDYVYSNISKQYTVTTSLNGEVSYYCKAMETIVFEDMYCGFVRYNNGFSLNNSKCDSHFLAFSSDRQIDKLLAAEVYYKPIEYTYSSQYQFDFWKVISGHGVDQTVESMTENDLGPQYVNVLSTQHVSYKGKGWFAQRYDFDRIETVADFIENEDLKDGSADRIKDMQWVLRFCETSFESNSISGGATSSSSYEKGTRITNATVLALTFETDGRVYDVGVVANMMTENPIPDNENQNDFNFDVLDPDVTPWWVWLILAVAVVVIVVVLLAVFVPTALPAIGNGLLWLLKGLWWLICLPFRGIAALARNAKKANAARKERRAASAAEKDRAEARKDRRRQGSREADNE